MSTVLAIPNPTQAAYTSDGIIGQTNFPGCDPENLGSTLSDSGEIENPSTPDMYDFQPGGLYQTELFPGGRFKPVEASSSSRIMKLLAVSVAAAGISKADVLRLPEWNDDSTWLNELPVDRLPATFTVSAAEIVAKRLAANNFKIVRETLAGEGLVMLRISEEFCLDVYPDGTVVIVKGQGAGREYYEFELSDWTRILAVLNAGTTLS